LAIIFADIDNFKKINDTYGHEAGDFILKKVANCFKKRLRAYDIISRLGGEEFIIALLGADLEAAKIVAEDLRKIVEKTPFMFRGKKIPVTLSLGVAVYNKENKLKDLIEKADKAMYEAKKTGKNKVVVYKEN
jgi:diguanylate cyclase (GGDEF)-like protein